MCIINYLAHAYLSFDHPGITVGNLISDFVKGKKKFDYPPAILAGINLHRQIDSYTDHHQATQLAKEIFRPAYRLYSGAFIDIVYDHFLANDKSVFSDSSLKNFSQQVYKLLDNNHTWLPSRFASMFTYMKAHDWLYNYRFQWGLSRSFGGLVHRAAYMKESETAFALFTSNYQRLQECYRQFWGDLAGFAKQQYLILHQSLL